MAHRYVSVDDFTGAITEILKDYADVVQEGTNEAVREVAEDSEKELKVAGSFRNRTRKYRKGWTITYAVKRYGLMAIVHNKLYQLTHLLESGHAKFLWGRATGERVQAFPHIAEVNEEAQRKLEEKVRKTISDI